VCEKESKREKWGESIHWHVFHCRGLFGGSNFLNNKRRNEKKFGRKNFLLFFCKSAIRSGSQQLTSGFSGASIGMASAQLGGQ
jgi:hypothetical protein